MKSTKEFIEHLKTLYENCQVYFDIQEKRIVVKNRRTKEERAEEVENIDRLKQARIRYQELRSLGRTDLPELPVSTEDFFSDGAYQPGEDHFQWLITKMDEWETNQNKKVENVGSLVEFLEWTATEQDRLRKEEELAQEKIIEEGILALVNLQIEQEQKELESFQKEVENNWKKIHRNFTLELKEKWEANGFNYSQVQEWVGIGLKPQDSGYASWIRDMLELTPLAYLDSLFSYSDNGNDKVLREQYQGYLEDGEDEESLLARAMALSLEDSDSEESGEVRNILLIGRTGSGKSTLGNVLVNKNGEFEETFKESAGSVSQTKNIQVEKFVVDLRKDGTEKIKYLVIDTIGFGDTQLNNKEVLQLLKELVPVIKQNGINQIFFVNDGRFTEKEIETYNLLASVLFDQEVVKYTTIVRTRFPEFEDLNDCEADRQKLREENGELMSILKNSKIVYVNNPPMVGRSAGSAKELREESRTRLLTHLAGFQSSYKPTNLETLGFRIDNYMNQEEKLNQEIAEKEQKIREREAELKKEVEAIQSQKSRDLRITGRNFERQTQELQAQSEKKIQTVRQELEEVSQTQLRESQQAYDQTINQISSSYQNNLNQIRNNYNQIRVGEPVCRYGHDYNIQTYNRAGALVSDHQSDFIGHIYCPTCGQTQTDFTLRNATTYTLEEWGRREAQAATERNQRMQEAIQEQERQRQEMINRIVRLRNERESVFRQELDQQRNRQESLLNQQQANQESSLNRQRQDLENQISASASSRETNARNQSQRQVQDWQTQIQQAEQSRSSMWKDFLNKKS